MSNITIIRGTSLHSLKNTIEDNLSHYGDGTIHTLIKPPSFNVRETTIPLVEKTNNSIKMPTSESNKNEVGNCLYISEIYGKLYPRQAGDERVWAYATHVTFCEYVHKRWPVPQQKKENESDGKFKKRQIKHVKAHYFAEGNRDIIRGNAISRLWWMGHIAKRCSYYNQEQTLKILLEKSDVRANILERPNLNMSQEIFNEIIHQLGKDLNKYKKKSKQVETLFDRNHFRNFMKRLNRIGGMKILNSLPEALLAQLIENIKSEVIAN